MASNYRVFTRTGRELHEGDQILFEGELWTLDEQHHDRKVLTHILDEDMPTGRRYGSYYANVHDVEITDLDGNVTFALGNEQITDPGAAAHIIDTAIGPDGDHMVLTVIGDTATLIYTYQGSHSPQVLTFDDPRQAHEAFRLTNTRWNGAR